MSDIVQSSIEHSRKATQTDDAYTIGSDLRDTPNDHVHEDC